jgi:hypothetical protein
MSRRDICCFMQQRDPEDEWRCREVRRLFVKHHPTAPTGADVYAFSAWLLHHEPDLLPTNRGTFYEDLKAALKGLWQD